MPRHRVHPAGTTPADRTSASRAARLAEGRRRLEVMLSPEANENLEALKKRWNATATEAVEIALRESVWPDPN